MSSVNFVKTVFKLCPRFIDKTYFTRCNARKFGIFAKMYSNSYFIEKKMVNNDNRQSGKSVNSYFLLGGIYTLFGLFKDKEDKEEDPEYITAMKRSILAIQVFKFLLK